MYLLLVSAKKPGEPGEQWKMAPRSESSLQLPQKCWTQGVRSLLAGRMEPVAVGAPASVSRPAGGLRNLPLSSKSSLDGSFAFPIAVSWDASSATCKGLQESSSQGGTGAGDCMDSQ